MSVDEFIETSKNKVATEEDIKAFGERIKKREEEFEKEFGKINNEFLNREYNI